MSANNVFVPYKYHDGDVKQLGNYATTVRDYVDYLERMFDRSEKVYYRGEEDGNDLSELTEDTIRQILSDKIFYTTVTVVLMSPNCTTGRCRRTSSGPGRSGPRKTYAMRTDAPWAAQ